MSQPAPKLTYSGIPIDEAVGLAREAADAILELHVPPEDRQEAFRRLSRCYTQNRPIRVTARLDWRKP